MSRTTLCVVTAAVLALLSGAIMLVRYQVMGDELRRSCGQGVWKVTLAVHGTSLGGARVATAIPLDLEHQQVDTEVYQSEQLSKKPPDASHPERRVVLWSQRGGAPDGPFRLRCEYHVSIDGSPRNTLMSRRTNSLYAAPRPGEYLGAEHGTDVNDEEISAAARRLTADLENPRNQHDVAEALFRFVADDIKNDPVDGPSASAVECLRNQRGDRLAQSRLLLALIRNRGIPARLVTGLALTKGSEQRPHYWVEAWLAAYNHWLPMCPFHKHQFGHVPSTYLVFGFGVKPLVRGRHVKDLDFAFLVERLPALDANAAGISPLKRMFLKLSLFSLPPAERRLVEILLLLPIAALIICIFRNVIGLSSFGTFAPALIGLAFHDLHSLPGIFVFVSILLIGWLMRRVLDHYHLLQVPRVATMLTLIMIVLIAAIVAANVYGAATTRYISLFPMIILCGMVERFWTLETEDSTRASFRTLFQTMLISTVIALVLSFAGLGQHMLRFPETLGLIMAAQLLIGRYTGYRLMELLRFRDFLKPPAPEHHAWAIDSEL
ncbi:MAG TPA: 7TM domain-containing protein [Gemmataceae bacterium]|nr:7TM domain-containing protein [Gemmataceae bacterium]